MSRRNRCAVCGDAYTPYKIGQQYATSVDKCNEMCRACLEFVYLEHQIAAQKAEKADDTEKKDKRKCVQCGCLYEPNTANQRFCSMACNKKHRQIKYQIKPRATKKSATYRPRKIQLCKCCGIRKAEWNGVCWMCERGR